MFLNNTTDIDLQNDTSAIIRHLQLGIPPPIFDTVPILITVIIIAGIGNVTIIWAFIADAKVRSKPSDFILLSLACADLGIAFFILPRVTHVRVTGRWHLGQIGCRISILLSSTIKLAAQYMVILLSWDRYKMLTLEYSYYIKQHTTKYIAKAIAITWFIASLKGIIGNILWKWTYYSLDIRARPNFSERCAAPPFITKIWSAIDLFLSVALVATLALLGVFIVTKLRARLMQFQRIGDSAQPASQPCGTLTTNSNSTTIFSTESSRSNTNAARENTDSSESSGSNTNATSGSKSTVQKRYIKPVITYIALVLTLLVCTLPGITLRVLMTFYPGTFYNRSNAIMTYSLLNYFGSLNFFTSCINPFLYAFTNARIREFYFKQYRALKRRMR